MALSILATACAGPAPVTVETSSSPVVTYTTPDLSEGVAATATLSPTAIDTPTSTPLPTRTPLPELPAEAADLQWITAYRLPGDQFATTIHPTRDGGFILVGGGRLLRLRADGFILWQTSLPQVKVLGVVETSSGDVILAGDLNWIKFDSQGNLLWQHPVEGAVHPTDQIIHLVQESNGNIVVESAGSWTVFSAEGELQSFTEYEASASTMSPEEVRERLDDNQFDYVFFVQTTADGGALVGNYMYSDYGDVANIVTDVLVSRLFEDGSIRWQKRHGGYFLASYDDVQAFETRSGDLIVAGALNYFANQADRNDVWVLRLGRDGNSRWDKLYATEGQDAVTVIGELENGDLIFAGQTSGAGSGDQDMWVLKTSAQGEILNCGLVFDGSVGLFGSFPEVEMTTLEAEQRPSAVDAQAIRLCAARPSP